MNSQPFNGVVTRNPATGADIAGYAFDDAERTDCLLARSASAFLSWRDTPVAQRAEMLFVLSETLSAEVDSLSALITTEMGKTIVEARAEVRKCATLAKWMAENGPRVLADERAPIEEAEVVVSFLPIGIVLGIMPWNFPLWQVVRAAIPILLGGNGFVLKHAPNVLGCAYALQSVFERSGAPTGLLTTLNLDNAATGALIGDPRIAAVTLTGSVRAGAAVASIAGGLIKKTLLELGGSDPFIVLADADLDAAVASAIKARFQNAGQVCLAAKRFILEAPIAEAFTARFVEAASRLTIGDPMAEATEIGPVAREDLRDGLHAQVEATSRGGGTLRLGGHPRDGAGYFYQPTVFVGIRPGMAAFDEETFGPVAALTVATDVDDAVVLANRSAFGLSGNLWTRDVVRARGLARRLETGGVFINGFTASDPRIPVGGVKNSGYGRELSHFGLREFVNAQTVWIKPSA